MRSAYVAVLCLVTLVAGFLGLGRPSSQVPTAVGAPAAVEPEPSVPQIPLANMDTAAAISLAELVRQLRATSTTTSTTKPKTTSTTAKKAVTTTTSRPATTTTKPVASSAPAATTTTVAKPLTPLTTLLEKVVPPAVAAAGALTKSDSGVASWFNAPDGTCAHRTLPKGTMIKVTRNHNGATATCKVNDWGPTAETGRLIDLSLDTFEKLAAKEAGLIDVRIEW
jgi:rare lipoprotein A